MEGREGRWKGWGCCVEEEKTHPSIRNLNFHLSGTLTCEAILILIHENINTHTTQTPLACVGDLNSATNTCEYAHYQSPSLPSHLRGRPGVRGGGAVRAAGPTART